MEITADRINQLKAEVKMECLRRSYVSTTPGSLSVSEYGSQSYDFTETPDSGIVIEVEHRDKNLIPLKAINASSLPNIEDNIATDAFITAMESFVITAKTQQQVNQSSNNNKCSGGCTGLCYSTCTSSCTGGCSDSNPCKGQCSTQCSNSCDDGDCFGCTQRCAANGCTSNCEQDGCTNACSVNGCTSSCQTDGCTGSCDNGNPCKGYCGAACESSCRSDGCFQSGCSNCANSCTSSCIAKCTNQTWTGDQ